MMREVEEVVLGKLAMREAMRQALETAFSGVLDENEATAFVMWLQGYTQTQIARVLVAHAGTPREKDGVSRSRAGQVLANAQRKMRDLTGLAIPRSGESIRRQGKRMTQRTQFIETRRPTSVTTPEGLLTEKEYTAK